jgi:hypothetical protein
VLLVAASKQEDFFMGFRNTKFELTAKSLDANKATNPYLATFTARKMCRCSLATSDHPVFIDRIQYRRFFAGGQ